MRRSIALLGLFAACADRMPADPGIEAISHVADYQIRRGGPPMYDLLIVIDDTAAMAPYQDRLAMLPAIVEHWTRSSWGGLLDIRIAVTTNDGILRRTPSVADPFVASQIEFDLARTTNYEWTLPDALAALMDIEATSGGPSQPLAALRLALEGNPDGFLREGAQLGIVIISAVDDASPLPVTEYASWLKSSSPWGLYITGIHANPSPRLDQLYRAFPNASLTISIDDSDHSLAFAPHGEHVTTILPGMCWTASDLDPEAPGSQYDCTFSAEIRGEERLLPPCVDDGDQFCWRLVHSNQGCVPGDHEPLRPEIPPYRFFAFNPKLRAQCVVLH